MNGYKVIHTIISNSNLKFIKEYEDNETMSSDDIINLSLKLYRTLNKIVKVDTKASIKVNNEEMELV